jgi:hypothetical protein
MSFFGQKWSDDRRCLRWSEDGPDSRSEHEGQRPQRSDPAALSATAKRTGGNSTMAMDLVFILLVSLFTCVFTVPCIKLALLFIIPCWKAFKVQMGWGPPPPPVEKAKKAKLKVDHIVHDKEHRLHDKDARLAQAKKHALAQKNKTGKKKKKKKKGPYLGSKVTPLPMIHEFDPQFMAEARPGGFLGPRAT